MSAYDSPTVDYTADLYDITVWVRGGNGRARLAPESAVSGASYDAAREIVSALGPLSHHIDAIQRGSFERDGERYSRSITYVHPDIPVIPHRKSAYREADIKLSDGIVSVTTGQKG